MQQHVAHAERARHRAGVLPARAAEAHQRAVARIDAARHRHLRDRLRHARVGDLDEAGRDLLGRALEARRRAARSHSAASARVDALARERERKAIGLDAAEREVRVGERELARAVASP